MGDNQIHNDYDLAINKRNELSDDIKKRFYPTKYIDKDQIGFVYHNIDLFIGRGKGQIQYMR